VLGWHTNSRGAREVSETLTMTALIQGTDFGHSNLTDYATFASKNLPVLYEPERAPTAETFKTLHSTISWTGSSLLNFMAEYYYWLEITQRHSVTSIVPLESRTIPTGLGWH
jgi:hypothetical protein